MVTQSDSQWMVMPFVWLLASAYLSEIRKTETAQLNAERAAHVYRRAGKVHCQCGIYSA